MANVQRPISIPEPINQVDSLWRTAQALKEAVEVIQGIRGNREYALLCDLQDATTIINNITGGTVPGITSLNALTDTDLTGQATGDLLYNFDGSNWRDTAGQIVWTGSALQLANDLAINWLNNAAASVELLKFSAPVAGGDPYWSEVQLLAKFEGIDAATAYTEVSANAAVASFSDNAQLDTAQSNFGSASLLLDGTTDTVTFPDIANYNLGTSDWTIEGFVRFNTLPPLETSAGPGYVFFSMWGASAADQVISYAVIQDAFGYRVRLAGDGFAEVGTISGGISTGTWYHWAMSRASGQIRAYFNGNYETSDFSVASADMEQSSEGIRIGSLDGSNANHDGWIDDVRVTIGTARYTGTSPITVPVADFGETGVVNEIFEIGDPGYVTNIEGSAIQINGVPIEQNATHTGEVTGATALTVNVVAITNKTDVVAEPDDDVLLHDDSDGALKKTNLSSITDGGYF